MMVEAAGFSEFDTGLLLSAGSLFSFLGGLATTTDFVEAHKPTFCRTPLNVFMYLALVCVLCFVVGLVSIPGVWIPVALLISFFYTRIMCHISSWLSFYCPTYEMNNYANLGHVARCVGYMGSQGTFAVLQEVNVRFPFLVAAAILTSYTIVISGVIIHRMAALESDLAALKHQRGSMSMNKRVSMLGKAARYFKRGSMRGVDAEVCAQTTRSSQAALARQLGNKDLVTISTVNNGDNIELVMNPMSASAITSI